MIQATINCGKKEKIDKTKLKDEKSSCGTFFTKLFKYAVPAVSLNDGNSPFFGQYTSPTFRSPFVALVEKKFAILFC